MNEVCSPITDERPQLRRPADPNMDDLSKRMNKMEPYGNGKVDRLQLQKYPWQNLLEI